MITSFMVDILLVLIFSFVSTESRNTSQDKEPSPRKPRTGHKVNVIYV